MKFKVSIIIAILLVGFTSCKTALLVAYKAEELKIVEDSSLHHPEIAQFISLYHDSLDKEMNETIAQNKVLLTKSQPESTLGNLLADALLEETQIALNKNIDVAVLNYGGIRLPQLSAGSITVGKVYELMPFDNLAVVIELSGDELQQLCNSMAASGGWPIAGATYIIVQKSAIEIKINGSPIEYKKKYRVVLSDYLANGGDKMELLKAIKQENTGIVLRDMFMKYFKRKGLLESSLNGRVVVRNADEDE